MQTQTLKILNQCFDPEKSRVIAEAMENEISNSKLVTLEVFNHAMEKQAWNLERAIHQLRDELMTWTVSMMAGQTALTVGLTTGIMYFLLKK
jgi:hypothetical protein